MLINKQNDFRDSIKKLLKYVYKSFDILSPQIRDLTKMINEINKKSDSLENNSISFQEIFYHYHSILKAINISYIIVFKSSEIWNVNFTSSIRSDRMDTHSNRFMRANATKNYLVVCSYPYQDKSSLKCINTIKQNSSFYGSNINVVCLEEFMDELLYNIFRYKCDIFGNLSLPKPKDELSIVNGERGIYIEHMYVEILNNKKNFKMFVNKVSEAEREQTIDSFLPNHYAIIIDKIFKDLKINVAEVCNIEAISVGGNGGKSDILLIIYLIDGRLYKKGISIKSSSTDNVAIHEKHAIDFINVLRIVDPILKNAFIQFEERRVLSKLDKISYSALYDYYIDNIHKIELLKWAIAGENTDSLKADYILLHSYCYNSREALGHAIKIYSIQEYIDELMGSDFDGSFGTHLTWTYKNNIQLKAPFIFN